MYWARPAVRCAHIGSCPEERAHNDVGGWKEVPRTQTTRLLVAHDIDMTGWGLVSSILFVESCSTVICETPRADENEEFMVGRAGAFPDDRGGPE